MAVSSLVSCSLSNCRTSASPTMDVPSRFWCPEPIPYSHPNLRYLNGDAAMSLVLAADYRVPDFDHWWAALTDDLPRLPSLGAHHIVVYRSLEDASPVFAPGWSPPPVDRPGLPGLGPHHIVVYRPPENPSRVFVTIGFREPPPV